MKFGRETNFNEYAEFDDAIHFFYCRIAFG